MMTLEKVMAIAICIALCLQRLSMAIGSICWGIAIVCFLGLLYMAYEKGDLQERVQNFKPYYKVIGFMIICYIPAVIFSVDIKTSIKAFFEMWIYRLMPFYMVTLFLQNKNWLQKIIMIFIVATCLDCLVAAGQVLFLDAYRGWGFGGHSLNLASLLSVMVPFLTIILFDDAFSAKIKKIAQIALFCAVIGLIAGKSRGAWLTLAIVLPLVAAHYIKQSKKALAISLAVVLLIGVDFAASPQYKQRLISISNTTTDTSNADRIRIWKSCGKMISDYPITGVGLGNFSKVYNSGYRLKETVQDLPHSHNNILQIWVETGTIGVIGFLSMSFFILFRNFKEWWKSNNPYNLIIWSSWLAFMIFGMFDLIIDHSAMTKAWWFLLAGILSVNEIRANKC